MEDERVIVRCYGDEPRICMVYQVRNDRVLVTDQNGLIRLRKGLNGPCPIGFPKDNVFEYSLIAEMQIKRMQYDKTRFEWGQLKPFRL